MGLKTISPSELHRRLRDEPCAVYDLNAPASWARARVPGAVRLEPGEYDEGALPADKSAPIVFYCSGPLCRKAPNAAKRARRLGHDDVLVMSAGIAGWLDAALPTESGEGV